MTSQATNYKVADRLQFQIPSAENDNLNLKLDLKIKDPN